MAETTDARDSSDLADPADLTDLSRGRHTVPVRLADWQLAPQLDWAFQHVADFLPSAPIPHGNGPVAELPTLSTPLGSVGFERYDGQGRTTVADTVASTWTDGWLVLHDGVLLAEEYPAGMPPDTRHLLMSVSKSLVGSVVGALTALGTLDVEAELSAYVPALAGSGYAGATVRNLLDMRSGIAFSEDYLDLGAEVRLLEQAIDWAPRTDPRVPGSMYEFLLTLRAKGPHGGPFDYKSCETDVLGWVCEAATGVRMPQLLSELLWSRLGTELDAQIAVDSTGAGMFDGGISAALRDLARFGAMLLREGTSLTGEQVLPAAWVRDCFAGGPDSRQAFAASDGDNRMPGGMYRNQFWLPYADRDVLLCLGIHGQMVYVDPAARLVGVKLSRWPAPQHAVALFDTLRAFDAIAGAVS